MSAIMRRECASAASAADEPAIGNSRFGTKVAADLRRLFGYRTMRLNSFIGLVVGIALALGFTFSLSGQEQIGVLRGPRGIPEEGNMDQDKSRTQYRCPPCGCASCGEISETKGACPDCSMGLVATGGKIDELREKAGVAWSSQDWPAATEALEALIAEDPTDGNAWYRLGYALHAAGRLDDALAAHVKATEFPEGRELGSYNAGCVYALKGDVDKAFEWLHRAVEAGFTQLAHVQQDSDLDSLRGDPRFPKLLEAMEAMRATLNQRNVAILVHEGVELLDFAGPGEVFSAARLPDGGGRAFNVFLVAETLEPITSQGFVTVTPEYTFDNCPKPDLLVLPGGATGRPLNSVKTMQWIEDTAPESEVVLSVCTGALLLAKAELLDGLQATTHHGSIAGLRRMAADAVVHEDARYVDNGRYVTSAGVSAGIDGALHVVKRLLGEKSAVDTAWYMEYDWTPEEDVKKGLVVPAPDRREPGIKRAAG